MMGYYGHGFGYASGIGGSYMICSLIGAVVLIDLILLGVWLWQKISKERNESVKSE
jgi:uncharacterized membrane protein